MPFTMISEILTHTPKWVFVLFALLVWLGMKQLVAGTVSLARVAVMPVLMTGLAIYGIVSAFGDSPMALVLWAVAAAATIALLLQRGVPASTRYDADKRQFHVAGSAVPLALMMGIFFTKYVVGVALAMHPQLAHQTGFAFGVCALYGIFSGAFAGRGIRMWKLALRSEAVATAANA